MQRFHDRREAGQLLARQLADYKDRDDVVVLALPRGGVPVASEIARELKVAARRVRRSQAWVCRGSPNWPWAPLPARGTEVLNGDVVTAYNIPPHVIRAVAEREGIELQRRLQEYRGNRAPLDLHELAVILVDDGLATGSTMRAAVRPFARTAPKAIVVAVPVAAAQTRAASFKAKSTTSSVFARPPISPRCGRFWNHEEVFRQTTDDEVPRSC